MSLGLVLETKDGYVVVNVATGAVTGYTQAATISVGEAYWFPTVPVAGQIVGVQAASAVGTLGPVISKVATGVQAASAVGTLAPTIAIVTTGVQAASAVGTLAPELATALGGVEATTAVGGLTPAYSVELAGVASTGFVEAVLTSNLSIEAVGVSATGAVGSTAPVASAQKGSIIWGRVSPHRTLGKTAHRGTMTFKRTT